MPELIQKPANAPEAPKSNGSEPAVFVMPKEYRGGGSAIVRKPTMAPVQPIPVEQPKPKPAPVPQPALKPTVPAAHRSALPYVVLGIGILLALTGGVVAYYAYQQTKKPVAEAPIQVPPTTVTAPTPEPTPIPVPEPPKKVEAGVDSDSDGLTDVEELRLYGTLVFNPDTDADSFLDGNETFHLYDPTKPNFARLAESGLVKTYTHPVLGYTVFVPISFVASESADGMQVTWSIPSGENMKITTYTDAEGRALMASQTLMPFTTKSGIKGSQSVDRLDTFLENNGRIYRMEYLLGGVKAIEYRQTYSMMLNSFQIVP